MMRDKSGRGNHATQGTAASRPIYTESGGLRFLAFDGVDDFLASGSVNLSATDEATVWAGVGTTSNVNIQVVFEFGANSGTVDGSFGMFAPVTAGVDNIAFRSRGTAMATATAASTPVGSYVVTGQCDISGDVTRIRANGAATSNGSDQGTGNYTANPIYIGRRAGTSLPFAGNVYGFILRGATSTDADVAASEAYMAGQSGVTL